jgi:tetratricopeptide (TPR) repeat protein
MARYRRASLFEKRNDYSRAIGDYDELLKIAPGSSDAYGRRGRAYRAIGSLSESLSDYTVQILRNLVTREHTTIAEIHITPLDNMVLRLLITPWPSISIRNLSMLTLIVARRVKLNMSMTSR